MKVAILYASKSGTTDTAAHVLAQEIERLGMDARLYDLNRPTPAPNADAVALGSCVRMGRLHRAALAYARAHKAELLAKPLALFVCRLGQDDTAPLLAAQLGQALAHHAVYADTLGGDLDFNRLHGLEKLIMKAAAKDGLPALPGVMRGEARLCAQALAKALGA